MLGGSQRNTLAHLLSFCSPGIASHCKTQLAISGYKASEISLGGSPGAEVRLEKHGEGINMGREKLLAHSFHNYSTLGLLGSCGKAIQLLTPFIDEKTDARDPC